MLKYILLLFILTGCSEFLLLSSGAGVVASQNAYAKAYNGVDILTIMQTEKGIKQHVYDKIKTD
jgi:hypothetical protein|tara:strand:- start:465 stop:656 length:192 start_codon:yes stop_codon:yes gene_type:complete